MILEEKRKDLSYIDENIVLFDNPSFDNSIVGVTDDNRAVYNFDRMIEELAVDDGISLEEAQEFIEYNTIRSLPYVDNSPIIVYPLGD